MQDILELISRGTVTRGDFQLLIETNYKSARERILRRVRPRDSNAGHDDRGHSGPPRAASRVAPRRGGGRLNDPRRTARGRRAVLQQEGATPPRAGFVTRKHFEPVCPHCGEVMGEKSYVPDHVRNESGDITGTTGLYRHRGDCYDMGPFAIEWPEGDGTMAVESECNAAGGEPADYKCRGKAVEALKLIRRHADPSEIYNIYWNNDRGKIFVSNGDWAEYDTSALYDALEGLLGKGKVDMESESGPPEDEDGWEVVKNETGGYSSEGLGRWAEPARFIHQHRGLALPLCEVRDREGTRRLAARLLASEDCPDRDWVWALYCRLEN